MSTQVELFPRARARGSIEASASSNALPGTVGFPRARARGSIEAYEAGSAVCRPRHFHAHARVAPLKPGKQFRVRAGGKVISTRTRAWLH